MDDVGDRVRGLIDPEQVRSVIQFGSSLYADDYADIDIAVIVLDDEFESFVRQVQPGRWDGFDVSLMREQEVFPLERFQFGGHGAHFARSLQMGRALIGDNPFLGVRLSAADIRSSVLARLHDYMYDVRKAVFQSTLERSIRERWPKFVRLCLYLIDESLRYPEVLRMPDGDVGLRLSGMGVSADPEDLLAAYENVWLRVR